MSTVFPPEVAFKGAWRPYQARVISQLEEHLDDRRLHVIAAPGSGKTILGLEAIFRLGKPALVISPTLAIRDQWIQRFRELFFHGQSLPSWVAFDLRKPGLLTSTTYQALHMAYAGRGGSDTDDDESDGDTEAAQTPEETPGTPMGDELVALLNKAGVETIVVDEAHHLRSEWWKTLTDVCGKLKNIRIVALTATPPCDVTYQEWQRYQAFCGPVDEEITVPELVLDNNLCPHQDYVYLSAPTAAESSRIKAFMGDVSDFCDSLLKDEAVMRALETHPAIVDAAQHIEEILQEPEYYTSIIIALRHAGRAFPRRIISLIGVKRENVPALSTEWLEILLTHAFYGDDQLLPLADEEKKRIRSRLSRIGAVERRKVCLKNTKGFTKTLMQSMSKLSSVVDIVRLESETLKNALRLVILSDFIRAEDLPRDPADIKPVTRMGVIPIFEELRRKEDLDVKLGCLCGTMIIIPRASVDDLHRIASEHQMALNTIRCVSLPADERYVEVDLEGRTDEKAVMLITQLFTEGGITVLVGTKSLLGEGWDAPCINALILASFVGSFVLSNQMRGRAIRTYKNDIGKTANVWHLVCVQETRNPFDRRLDLGPDWEMVKRRFKAFVGVSYRETIIENGFERLGITIDDRRRITMVNDSTKARAKDRPGLRKAWEAALQRGIDGVRMVEEVEAPREIVPRNYIFQNTLRWLMIQACIWGAYAFEQILARMRNLTFKQLILATLLAGCASFVIALPFFIKSAWIYLRYGPVEGSIRQIGEAIFRTMVFCNIIKTDPAKIGVKTRTDQNGWVSCSLEGASSFEKSIYLDALEEVLGPITNPRYLITRNSIVFRYLRRDYHVVPEVLATNKDKAEYFVKMWRKYVGPTDLIYTRTVEGRGLLVRARGASLSGQFLKRAQRLSVWK